LTGNDLGFCIRLESQAMPGETSLALPFPQRRITEGSHKVSAGM
jgi:hypothetical protein